MLFVIDGSKALRKAIRAVFGEAPVQRCIRHKERNVLEHLPERDRPALKRRLREAWALEDHDQALDRLNILGAELERSYPGAAGSLREGIAEMLTLTRLGINGSLKRTLASTNPCESMIECVRRTSRNVKRWQSGEMALRWTAAGCSKRNASSAGSSATATSPASPSRSSATLSLAVTPMPDARPTEEVGAAQRRAPVVPFALGKRGRR
jgi:transposase-like protein